MQPTDNRSWLNDLPTVRGKLELGVGLAPFTWFRVGGPADVLFQPADEEDLATFLKACPQQVPVLPLGVGSNVIIRDGGVPGVVVRLSPRGFGQVKVDGTNVVAGAAALDAMVARTAAKAGIAGLEFFRGVPGTIGGALRMNAGCYGTETKDVLVSCVAYDRGGERHELSVDDMGYTYRHSAAPADLIFVAAVFQGVTDDPVVVQTRMEEITARREASQPIRDRTGGSTFKNPDQVQSKGRKSWEVIDAAGLRGHKVGGAQMSEKHCNFMINTGDATAAELEALGEAVIKRVRESQGVDLEWEIKRLGRA